jgi:hypothetical protein
MWFIRIGSKITGPHSESQLRGMRQRGQFSTMHQISTDRLQWQSAAALVQMLDASGGPKSPWEPNASHSSPSSNIPSHRPPAPTVQEWYYLDANQAKRGPLTSSEVINLARHGIIIRTTLVYEPSSRSWLPASQIPVIAGFVAASHATRTTPVTTVLDQIFDPLRGWTFTETQVPLTRSVEIDGSVCFTAFVDGIVIEVREQPERTIQGSPAIPASRLIAQTTVLGVKLSNPTALLNASFDTCGLPSIGVDRQGRISLQAAFPYSYIIPVEIARKQLMVCLGTIADEANELLQALGENADTRPAELKPVSGVVGIAAALVRGFIGF